MQVCIFLLGSNIQVSSAGQFHPQDKETVVKFRIAAMLAGLLAISAAGVTLARTQTSQAPPDDVLVTAHIPHDYTPYEKLILKNVSQFHKNFNAREFEKNGELVADNLRVNSLGTTVVGRAAFVSRIGRFVGPFPDVKIDDQIILVDGNSAVTRFTITGTQKGDLQTPEGVIPATGKTIHVDGIELFTFDKEGKLTDLVTTENLAQLIQQLKATN
jgi:steroid delta-isomerase-like uncharacterized protein